MLVSYTNILGNISNNKGGDNKSLEQRRWKLLNFYYSIPRVLYGNILCLFHSCQDQLVLYHASVHGLPKGMSAGGFRHRKVAIQ